MRVLAFCGSKSDFAAYLASQRNSKVVDLAWYRHKKKAAIEAANVNAKSLS
ncbi:MAG TPA: hypothetical protein VLH56_14430 [Dissulfurispiraceae bacterium]|nr:hypothetical protein [Dissulfurispiraceae bacterium]